MDVKFMFGAGDIYPASLIFYYEPVTFSCRAQFDYPFSMK